MLVIFSFFKKEMNSTCSVCEKSEFLAIIEKFQIDCDEHINIDRNSLNSFVETFSKILAMDPQSIIENIRRRRRSNAFSQLKLIEYGRNLMNVDTEMRSVENLAWIGSLAEESGRNILVFCDFLCLNFLHQGDHVILIRPTEPSSQSPAACVLSSLNMYHPIVESPILVDIWERYEFTALEFSNNSENNEDYQEPVSNAVQTIEIMARDDEIIQEDQGMPIGDVVVDEDDTIEFSIDNNVIELSNARTSDDPVPEASSTLDEFLIEFYPNCSMNDITPGAYTSSIKLDIYESQQQNTILNYNKTYDIDGLFGYFPIECFGDIVQCPVDMCVNPTFVDKRTVNTLKRLIEDISGRFVKAAIIGTIELPLGKIDLIIVLDFEWEIGDAMITSILKKCAEFARKLPCEQDLEHEDNCDSKAILQSHRSTRRASTWTHRRNETEKYGISLAKCYMYHFVKILRRRLSSLNFTGSINCFFKCIGCKAATYSESLPRCLSYLETFSNSINLEAVNDRNIWIDLAMTVSAEGSNEGPVKYKIFLLH